MAVMRGVGRIRQQENKPALGYISSPVYVKAARTRTRGLIKGRRCAGKGRGTEDGKRETETGDERCDVETRRADGNADRGVEARGRGEERSGTDGEGSCKNRNSGTLSSSR